jgi:hypothetical protein
MDALCAVGRDDVEARILIGGPKRGSLRQELAEVLRVARGHGDDGRFDRHELAYCWLRAAATDTSDAERDLVAAAPLVAWPAENVAGHREQDGVVVQATSCRVP